MKQVFNPYLPLYEHIPDGEPHLFDGRVYIYGSHDRANGTAYCEQDYAIWSAPEDDLKSWRYEGVAYRKEQDSSNLDGDMQLWAPDVCKGPDGRYYMYYCFNFHNEIGVAVSDTPAGPFAFYGHVKYPEGILNGKTLEEYMPFDPAVFVDDDGRIYLYYGFCPAKEKEIHFPSFTEEELSRMPEEEQKTARALMAVKFGENSMVAELEKDMVTLKEVPRDLIPGGNHTDGTGFEGHGFFEASSMRKIKGKYYFVYSSHKSAELCYAISDRPDRDFVYGGTIVSNGDMGLNGRTAPVNTMGNNHGGIVEANGEYYIFYHRQTNGTEFSRQGCAEKIEIKADGSIDQVEITSCGLNRGPLAGSGTYPAAICCHMTSPATMAEIDYSSPEVKKQTRIVEPTAGDVYVASIENGTILGYKYFDCRDVKGIILEMQGDFLGTVTISADEGKGCIYGEKKVEFHCDVWKNSFIPADIHVGKTAIYIHFAGKGSCAMRTLGFMEDRYD